jgi:hypothetical protein
MARKSVKIVCQAGCGGTGVYMGFCEPRRIAVVCTGCDGTGCQTFYYKPFTKRINRKGVKEVRNSRGNFILTGVGPTGSSITYEQFKKGAKPKYE